MTGIGDVVLIPRSSASGELMPPARGTIVSIPGVRNRHLHDALLSDETVVQISPGHMFVTNHPQDLERVDYDDYTIADRVRRLMLRGPEDFVFDRGDDEKLRAQDEWHQHMAMELAGVDVENDNWPSWSEAMVTAAERLDELEARVAELEQRIETFRAGTRAWLDGEVPLVDGQIVSDS